MSNYKPNALKSILHKSRRILAGAVINIIKPINIAITGSQGKTNTTNILATLFPEAQVTDTNLDTIYNVPITALKLRPHHKLAIFELGIDRNNEMSLHLEIVKPNISIITGISPVHSDAEHLGSLANIITEKRKIIEVLKATDFAILNWDDENVRAMAPFTKAQVLFYGSTLEASSTCPVYAPKSMDLQLTTQGTSFNIVFQGITQTINTKLIGIHHISNIMAGFLAYYVVHTKFSNALSQPILDSKTLLESFANKIAGIEPLKGRMSIEAGPNSSIILNDSLRANPDSTKAGLTTLAGMQDIKGKRIAILGEMGELGDLSEIKHREIGALIATLPIDLVIGIGPLQKFALAEALAKNVAPEKLIYAENVLEAAKALKPVINANDIIYLKGSLLRHLERIWMLYENQESVKCLVTSCPLYNHCSKCPHKESGYQE